MCSRSLSFGQRVDRLDSLAYIESITDAYSQYFVFDLEHTENNKQCQSAGYLLKKFLLASAWSSISFLRISAECTA